MSLPAQNPYQQVVATLGQTVIPFTFRCDSSGQLIVWVNDTQVGGFTPALNADQTASPGGTVTLAVGSAAGDVVTVERVNPQTQTFALSSYTPFTATALNSALDRMVELLQEFYAKLARVFYIKRSQQSKISSFELPAPASGGILGWFTSDGGVSYTLVNYSTVTDSTGVRIKNEIPAGSTTGTTGADGNPAFVLAHTPKSASLLDVFVDGVRADPTANYSLAAGTITFNSGYIPLAGSVIRADYYY
jgi:hypothetical protein